MRSQRNTPPLMPVEEALQRLMAAAPFLGSEEVGLEDSLDRVLQEEVRADRDQPPTDRSAMDGFAVRTGDLPEPGRTLRVVGELRAGQPPAGRRVGPGEAVRIMTGAVMPPGADAVVMVELTEEDPSAGTVTVMAVPEPGQHIRRRAEDVEAGETLLEPGMWVGPAEVALLATVGRVRVRVGRRPRVAVFSTGDEVVDPSAVPEPHQVRNSNAPMLQARLRRNGIEAEDLGRVGDQRGELRAHLRRALEADLLLITGGVSAGRYDLVVDTLESLGVRRLFHRVAMRPGKPVFAGHHDGGLVLGLPGNPVSAFTGCHVFAEPALRRMMGARRPEPKRVSAVLVEPLRRKPGRLTYHLVRAENGEAGLEVRPIRTLGSADVVSLARANAFAVTPGGARAIPAGATVPVELWPDWPWR